MVPQLPRQWGLGHSQGLPGRMCSEPLLAAGGPEWQASVSGSPVGGGRATDTSFCSGLGGSGGVCFGCLSSLASFYLYDKTHRRMPFLGLGPVHSRSPPPKPGTCPVPSAYANSASLWPWAGELCRRVSGSRALSPEPDSYHCSGDVCRMGG